MEGINLNGVSFRWSEDRLLITTAHGQDILAGSQVAQLLDFLQVHQQRIYRHEQNRDLPSWVQDHARYDTGQIVDQVPRLKG